MIGRWLGTGRKKVCGQDGQTRLLSGVKGHNCYFERKGVGKCRTNSTGRTATALDTYMHLTWDAKSGVDFDVDAMNITLLPWIFCVWEHIDRPGHCLCYDVPILVVV